MPLAWAVLIAVCSLLAGYLPVKRVWPEASLGEKLAFAAGLSLALSAYVIFAFGYYGMLRVGIVTSGSLLLIAAVTGARTLWQDLALSHPSRQWWGAIVLLPFFSIAFVSAFTPPLPIEWDSLAYHLALPKLWLQADRVQAFPYDHHSYFPQLAEMLFTAAYWVGGYGTAKAVHTWMSICCVLACAGFAARKVSARAGVWAAVVLSACPLALWEAGTAYVDMATALYTLLGVFLLCDFAAAWSLDIGTRVRYGVWIGICGGLTAATKYTGLLTLFFLSVGIFLLGIKGDKARGASGRESAATPTITSAKTALLSLFVGLAVASPWYVRTYVDTGNPVYPFAYGVFGGRYWSAQNAEIYRGEQLSFGVGRNAWELLRVPWDLNVRPERYLNQGGLIGAVGIPIILSPILLLFARRRLKEYWYILSFCAANIVVWFWLSQQSRYLLALVPALAVIGGWCACADERQIRSWSRAAIVLQACFTFYLFGPFGPSVPGAPVTLREGVKVAFRAPNSPEVRQFLWERSASYRAAQAVNALEASAKVALYDEVLGYYFDREYSWSNPGHHTLIPYEDIANGEELVAVLKDQGFTHVLVNLGMLPPGRREVWTAMLDSASHPTENSSKLEPWREQLAEAVARGLLVREDLDPGPSYRLYRILGSKR